MDNQKQSSKVPANVHITVDTKTVIRTILLVVLSILGLAILQRISSALIIIIISLFLALALNPVVSAIANRLKSKSRALATGAAYLLVIGFLATFFALVVPPLVNQISDFVREIPQKVEELQREDSSFHNFAEKYNVDDAVQRFTQDFGKNFGNIGQTTISTATTVGSTVANMVIVLVMTFMMLVEGPKWLERFWSVQNPKKRKSRRDLAQKMYKVVTSYVNGQVFIAALGGFFATVAIFIFAQIFDADVNAVALGGIMGIFALMPMVGIFIGSALVILATLLVSVPLAIAILIYIIIYQQIENATIQPFVQARGSNLTPLLVFLAVVIGVAFGGLLGAFLAIPTAGCIKLLVEDYYKNRSKLKQSV